MEKTYNLHWAHEGKKHEGIMTASYNGEKSSVSIENNYQHQTFDYFEGTEEQVENIVNDVKSLDYDITDFEI